MLITLTTDFGYKDSYIGIMKAVILGIYPAAQIIDLTHGIPPQDIMAGALNLRYSIPYFSRGSIHVVVVDPGVGSPRRPILIESGGNYLIGPDNGVLSLAVEKDKAKTVTHLANPNYHLRHAGTTFHGRDIFAPAAAHLARGITPAQLGEQLDDFARLPWPATLRSPTTVEGEIIYIDGFGNLFTNIFETDLHNAQKELVTVCLERVLIHGIARSYSSCEAGSYVAVINSWGLVEIAVNGGSAQQNSGAKPGNKVKISMH
jgi:S-adenosyl-L-methionine hydrolase (adenosine-forming)